MMRVCCIVKTGKCNSNLTAKLSLNIQHTVKANSPSLPVKTHSKRNPRAKDTIKMSDERKKEPSVGAGSTTHGLISKARPPPSGLCRSTRTGEEGEGERRKHLPSRCKQRAGGLCGCSSCSSLSAHVECWQAAVQAERGDLCLC